MDITTQQHKHDAGDTLALVNTILSSYGKAPLTDLPSGTQGAASDCVYARALRDVGATRVDGQTIKFHTIAEAAKVAELWGVEQIDYSVATPSQMGRFIHDFDRGLVPQYSDRTNR